MEIITIIILFLATLCFINYNNVRSDQAEKSRFREFVIASKTKNIDEYVQAMPNDDAKFEEHVEDELVDLDQLSPEELLNIKRKEYGGD